MGVIKIYQLLFAQSNYYTYYCSMENQTTQSKCGCTRPNSCASCRTEEERRIYWEEKLEDLECDCDEREEDCGDE